MTGHTVPVGHCAACGADHHPVARHCPRCRGVVHRAERTGRGVVLTWTVVARPPNGSDVPQRVVLVQLDRDDQDQEGAFVLAATDDATLQTGHRVDLQSRPDGRVQAERTA